MHNALKMSGDISPTQKTKPIIIKIQGYFVNYDKYNRAKLMFLDDYNSDEPEKKSNTLGKKEVSFAKKYLLLKSKHMMHSDGHSPVSDDEKYFLVNCPKNSIGFFDNVVDGTNATIIRDDKKEFATNVVPLISLKQHTVECIVKVNYYNFTKNGEKIHGWNLKLLKMSLHNF